MRELNDFKKRIEVLESKNQFEDIKIVFNVIDKKENGLIHVCAKEIIPFGKGETIRKSADEWIPSN